MNKYNKKWLPFENIAIAQDDYVTEYLEEL